MPSLLETPQDRFAYANQMLVIVESRLYDYDIKECDDKGKYQQLCDAKTYYIAMANKAQKEMSK